MHRKNAPRKSAQRTVIYVTFLFLLSLPLVLWGLYQENFDTRNRAYEELELSDENPCIISLPNVNPYTLEVGKTVTIEVNALLQYSGISGVEITDSSGIPIYQKTFEDSPLQIATSFNFTPSKSGQIDIIGSIQKAEGGSVACKISSPYDIKGLRAVPNNNSPEFSSLPSASKPSQDIKTEQKYEYTLTAEDIDGDRINYFYSFTPRADWLKPTIIEDGSGGKLTIKFAGYTDKPASYLANVFIHDGYSKHLRSQSWVLSVSPLENDIPMIKITNPVESLRLDKGATFPTSWDVSDLNHIARFQLFMAKNPTDESSWITVDNNIPYNTTNYNVKTSSLESGTYKLIAKAIDNQDPPAIGTAISPEIVISSSGDIDPDTDDVVQLEEPQVINMTPSSTDEITNPRPTIKGSIVASNGATIKQDSIVFKLDDVDLSKDIRINKISDIQFTIIYQPESDLLGGEHKAEIYFEDSSDKNTTKSWNFTLTLEEENNSDYYNIFGYQISKRIVTIIGIGFLIILLALAAPFVIASIWKDEDDISENKRLVPTIPSEKNKYIETFENEDIKEKVTADVTTEEEPEEKDVWNAYVAPTPMETTTPSPVPTFEESTEEEISPITPITEEVPVYTPKLIQSEEPEKDKTEGTVATPPLDAELPEILPVVEDSTIPTAESTEEQEVKLPPTNQPVATVEEPVSTDQPVIPEPEIPTSSDFEKILEQINAQKDQSNGQ